MSVKPTQAHTPGPWKHVTAMGILDRENQLVADPYEYLGDITIIRANARLIAAAPELLEALKEIEARAVFMKVKDPTYATTHWEYVRQTCLSVIAKAEGKN